MEIKDVHVWKPIEFSEAWEQCSTSKLDVLLPSWVRRRQTLKEDSKAYNQFMDRLKRQHAIETGVIEKLYDLSEGVTETFIKEGFVESYLQHGDTNIPPHQLMNYLNDNFSAIDFIFDVVKNNRQFTVSFIKELHHLITTHQESAEGRDQFGNRLQIPLIKGAFKEWENNPTRASDGKRFVYCPPVHVAAEMDNLVAILAELEGRNVKPLLVATWLHHAFVIIHPFQDGNGRVARLLASLVLIKNGLFPLTVKRGEKKRYIDALELADNGEPQKLVDYFGEMQKKNIEGALNMRLEVDLDKTSLLEIASLLANKLEIEKNKNEESAAFQERIERNTALIISIVARALKGLLSDIQSIFKDTGKFFFPSHMPLQDGYIADKLFEYAHQHNYVFVSNTKSNNLISGVEIIGCNDYRLVVSIHQFGEDTSTLAISALLFRKSEQKEFYELALNYPSFEPFTMSVDTDEESLEKSELEVKSYLTHVMTLTLAQISSEINP